MVVDGAFTLFSTIDVLLIGAILSVSAVGLFEAAYRLAGLLVFIGAPVRSAVAPRLTRGGGGPDHEALETALHYMVLIQGVVLAPMIVWAEPLTRIVLGTDYLGSIDTLRALAPFALLIGDLAPPGGRGELPRRGGTAGSRSRSARWP